MWGHHGTGLKSGARVGTGRFVPFPFVFISNRTVIKFPPLRLPNPPNTSGRIQSFSGKISDPTVSISCGIDLGRVFSGFLILYAVEVDLGIFCAYEP